MSNVNEKNHKKIATFAGGCFWCMQPPFEKIKGVEKVLCGYMGGHVKNVTYEQVCTGKTGHLEVVQVYYDQTVVSYDELLDVFWVNVDPTDADGQFVDQGSQYRTAIFYHSDEQQRSALASKKRLAASGQYTKPIVTEIRQAEDFIVAEDYHQSYYKTQPFRYKSYRSSSGRDEYIKHIKMRGSNTTS